MLHSVLATLGLSLALAGPVHAATSSTLAASSNNSALTSATLRPPTIAPANERVLASEQTQVNLRSYGRNAIFSVQSGSSYTLVASTDGGPTKPLNVPAHPAAIEADIAHGPGGEPTVVFPACDAVGCEINLLKLDGSEPQSTGIQVYRGSQPTLWNKTVAWVGNGRVRTSTRTLYRVPKGVEVLGLELSSHQLAMTVKVPEGATGACGVRELWVLKLGAKRPRQIARQICGLNGQVLSKASFDSGWLYFSRHCNTNCGSRYGTYRYRNGRYELAGDSHPLEDWAWGGRDSVYQQRAPNDLGCSEPSSLCTVVWTNDLKFKPVRPPRSFLE
ncbi:hypothetical protein OJ998_02170 [Solirubrobacter taibaiensis]|nr:hypothetical protein [Solirubrobacter taibaiensis]